MHRPNELHTKDLKDFEREFECPACGPKSLLSIELEETWRTPLTEARIDEESLEIDWPDGDELDEDTPQPGENSYHADQILVICCNQCGKRIGEATPELMKTLQK